MSRLLTDDELEWYENNIANASAIGRKLAILATIEDDPDKLELILDTVKAAESLRLDLIKRRDELRESRKENGI